LHSIFTDPALNTVQKLIREKLSFYQLLMPASLAIRCRQPFNDTQCLTRSLAAPPKNSLSINSAFISFLISPNPFPPAFNALPKRLRTRSAASRRRGERPLRKPLKTHFLSMFQPCSPRYRCSHQDSQLATPASNPLAIVGQRIRQVDQLQSIFKLATISARGPFATLDGDVCFRTRPDQVVPASPVLPKADMRGGGF
jgi:hypothetical protein